MAETGYELVTELVATFYKRSAGLPRCRSYDGYELGAMSVTTWQDNGPSPGGGSCWE